MNDTIVTLVVSTFLLFPLMLIGVAFKARMANRSVWKRLEEERRQRENEANSQRRQWQLCYGRLAALEHLLLKPVRLTAQYAEDVFLLGYFQGRSDGVYVDVGAYNGIDLSNTFALYQIGWRGLLIEANPANAERCCQSRPHDIVENCAVGGPSASGNVLFTVVEGENGVDALSFVESDTFHRERCSRENGSFKTLQVPFTNLTDVLVKHATTTIDLLSIDIEGGEIQALEGLNFGSIRPQLVIVESTSKQSEYALQSFFEPLNYHVIYRTDMNLFFEDASVSK